MVLKEFIKDRLPAPVLEGIRHRRAVSNAKKHRCMSQEEAEAWLADRYRATIGAELNLENPRRFTEKIQWCKLHAMDTTKSMLADKYAVRCWVADRIGKEHLIPLLGTWDSPSDIEFSRLPKAFVLKTNNASGTNIIVTDKASLNERAVKAQLGRWLSEDYGWLEFEPQYLRIPPKVIAEEYICNKDGSELMDYKVLCFDGVPMYIWVDIDRHKRHSRVVFDVDWNVQPWNQFHYPDALSVPDRPEALYEMLELASTLSAGFAQVRVDFYIIEGTPLFGEMTFTDGSGFEEIRPDEWDFRLGELWDLSAEPRSEIPWGSRLTR